MSLVSAIPSEKPQNKTTSNVTSRTTSIISVGSKKQSKIYQTNGGELSKEALYRAKMKYGYYQSPVQTYNVGVTNAKSSADAAASLANNSHTNVETYVRQLDPNAAKAAVAISNLKASNNSQNYKKSHRGTDISHNKSGIGASNAASKAYSMTSSTSRPSVTPERNYSLVSNGSVTGKTYSMTSSISSSKPNMKKLYSNASKRADSNIKERWEPTRKDYTYGIKTKASENNRFDLSDKTVINDLYAQAKNSSIIKAQKKKDAEQKAKKAKQAAAALKAAISVKDIDPSSSIDQEIEEKQAKRDLYLKQLTSTQVMSMARKRVDAQLKLLEEQDLPNRLFDNDAYNRAAVSVAQKSFSKKSKNTGKINIGGGLWLSPDDITKISEDLLSPVLGEISARAEEQRANDVEIRDRTAKYNKSLSSWKAMQTQKEKNDVQIMNDTNEKHETQMTELKEKTDAKYKEMVDKMEGILAMKKRELDDTNQSYDDLEVEIGMKLDLEKERSTKEIKNWTKSKEKDVSRTEKKQEKLMQPYYEEYNESLKQHENLSSEYDTVQKKIKFLRESIDNHKAKIEEYSTTLQTQYGREERENLEVENLLNEKEEISQNITDCVMVKVQKIKEEAALSANEAQLRELEVEAAINERNINLNELEMELQRERLNLLEAMQKVAAVRGDEQLDEEKVKAFIGKTSAEFIKENVPEKEENDESEENENTEGGDKDSTNKQLENSDSVSKSKVVGTETKHSTTTQTAKKPSPATVRTTSTKPVTTSTNKSSSSTSVFKSLFIGPARTNRMVENKTTTVAETQPVKKESKKVKKEEGATKRGATTEKKVEEKKKLDKEKNTKLESKDDDMDGASFSGFSQGSINEEDFLDKNDDENANKDGYFKEVF